MKVNKIRNGLNSVNQALLLNQSKIIIMPFKTWK